ncbi:MAG: hypothetical protein AVDCRST_MAG03-799 [uncultured Rubrobacteraceae bacterium]|uniref:Uncharacterized protein n=1 Tax=uncultured Rubrobacteraceae bacterium TaxID=349277 RepID=A0A6J4NNZ1_9ACTN|nr:MAG: hypothetical protein AVDCRST_MAG03-799 [uncultured Rubrobacteraceae bacterium]
MALELLVVNEPLSVELDVAILLAPLGRQSPREGRVTLF